jgi:hypothetical protein
LKIARRKRVLIAGADPLVTKKDLIDRFDADARLVRCCVDLGSEVRRYAYPTRKRRSAGSARQSTGRVRLITNDWHMRVRL